MRRSLVAAVLALVVLAWPAQAQLFPSPGSAEPKPVSDVSAARTILDLTARVSPGGRPEGHCLVLGAGHLDGTVALVGTGTPRPVVFGIYRVRGASDALMIVDQPIGRDPFAFASDIAEGLFCYSVTNKEPEPPGAGLAQLSGLDQDVALKLTLAPAPAP